MACSCVNMHEYWLLKRSECPTSMASGQIFASITFECYFITHNFVNPSWCKILLCTRNSCRIIKFGWPTSSTSIEISASISFKGNSSRGVSLKMFISKTTAEGYQHYRKNSDGYWFHLNTIFDSIHYGNSIYNVILIDF